MWFKKTIDFTRDRGKAEKAIYRELKQTFPQGVPTSVNGGYMEIKHFIKVCFSRSFMLGYSRIQTLSASYQYDEYFTKHSKSKGYKLGRQVEYEIQKFLKENANSLIIRLKNSNFELLKDKIPSFGYSLGFLIALFRCHPLGIFRRSTEELVGIIKLLENKQYIFDYVKERLHELVLKKISRHTNKFNNLKRTDLPNRYFWVSIYEKYKYIKIQLPL